jgi:hypothetical protein
MARENPATVDIIRFGPKDLRDRSITPISDEPGRKEIAFGRLGGGSRWSSICYHTHAVKAAHDSVSVPVPPCLNGFIVGLGGSSS